MSNSQAQSDVDELFDVKNSYYIGNFQQCIKEAQKAKVSSADIKLERDIYLYFAYIAQKKYKIVIDEVNDKSPVELQALKLLAEYMLTPNRRASILDTFVGKFGSSEIENHYVILVGATMYFFDEQIEKALQLLHLDDHLESLSLTLQIYLHMSRTDLARRELKKMQDKDEDSTLTQLAQAWVNIFLGRDKLQDAYYTLQEIIDKYGSSISLLNCQAVCYIGQGKYEEADSVLQEAMEKDSNDANTLINSIVLSANISKFSEMGSRYLTQLRESYPDSPFVTEFNEKEKEFDHLCQEYGIMV
ncbi:hypothetical protein V9T40_014500 [Parthenolecanium corni]|uniref:Coatomer subunit epsilon n=1 Tax=Parthenolecanium corni TaxID=536013 RepID=A0AAN9T3B3_9HEMI